MQSGSAGCGGCGVSDPLDPRILAAIVAAVRELDAARDRDASAGGLLTTVQAAKYLALSPSKLYRLPLPRVRISEPGGERTHWRYRKSDLDAYIAGRVVAPFTKETAA